MQVNSIKRRLEIVSQLEHYQNKATINKVTVSYITFRFSSFLCMRPLTLVSVFVCGSAPDPDERQRRPN